MTEITLVKQQPVELTEAERAVLRRVIFGIIDGLGERGKRQWRRLWNSILRLEPGEMLALQTHLARSGPFHRRHFALEQALFDAQERFEVFEQYLYWIKVGAGLRGRQGHLAAWCRSRKASPTRRPTKTSFASSTCRSSSSCAGRMPRATSGRT